MKYRLTQKDKDLLPTWRDHVIESINSTTPMSNEDQIKSTQAIYQIYESAKLDKPKVVFVKSPFAARFAAGFFAALIYKRKNKNVSAVTAAAADAADADADAAADAADADAAAADAAAAVVSAAAVSAAAVTAADAAADAAVDDVAAADVVSAAADVVSAADAAAAAAAAAAADADAAYDKNTFVYGSKKAYMKASLKLGLGSFGLKVVTRSYWRFSWRWELVRRVTFAGFFRRTDMKVNLDKIIKYEDLLFSSGFATLCKGAVFVSDRPISVSMNDRKQLHNFNGPAAKWSDGSAVYLIHGVRVPVWICETKKEDLTKDMIVNEQNADYRRCIIQKIGIEKAIELLGAEVIDSYDSPVGGKYELLSIDYDGRGKRPYLKMRSKSIDAWHIEGIKPGIETAKEALAYRNGMDTYIEPKALT